MNMNSEGLGTVRWGVLLAIILIPIACGQGDEDQVSLPALRHPIAEAADGVVAQLANLDPEDAALIENFRKTATPTLGSYEARQVCGALGKALAVADSETVADFVLEVHEHLYAEFFAPFDTGAIVNLADSLRVTAEIPELTVLRIEYLLREAQGAYSGTLLNAAAEVPFLDVVTPRLMPVEWLTPAEDAPREVYTGAAAALCRPECVIGGARPDLAMKVYRQALDRWPGDPVFVSGMVSLLIENEDREPERMMSFLVEASERDPENAAWLYLLAARHFRAGQDAKAHAALSAAGRRPQLTFHGVNRVKRTADFLTALGYSPIRARVVACRLTSSAAVMDLKLAGSKALLRSYEYDDLESCRVLLELPLVIERQLGDSPRLLITDQVLLSLSASGLPRLADLSDRNRSGVHTDAAAAAARRLKAIEDGERLCGGLSAWGKILEHAGEEVFLRFLDRILIGGETRFLESCAGAEGLDACLSQFR